MKTWGSMILCLGLLGCSAQNTRTAESPVTHVPEYAPTLSSLEAQRLSPEESKAILVARAIFEEREKRASQVRCVVHKNDDGWDVYVAPVGPLPDSPITPGGFVDIYLAHDYQLIKIVGGA